MNIGELKKLIKDLPSNMEVRVDTFYGAPVRTSLQLSTHFFGWIDALGELRQRQPDHFKRSNCLVLQVKKNGEQDEQSSNYSRNAASNQSLQSWKGM